jgi:hypothetical protein
MQEITDSIKRQTWEAEEVQTKGMCIILNKLITENFPNLEKSMPTQMQEGSRTQTDCTKIELLHGI